MHKLQYTLKMINSSGEAITCVAKWYFSYFSIFVKNIVNIKKFCISTKHLEKIFTLCNVSFFKDTDHDQPMVKYLGGMVLHCRKRIKIEGLGAFNGHQYRIFFKFDTISYQ